MFSNAIRLLVFLSTGWLIKFYQHVFCFFKIWFRKGQYDPFHTIIDNFYHVFNEFCCLWVLSPRIWNVLWMRFFQKWIFASIKKMERFLFYFWVEDMLSPNIWYCHLNPTLNRLPFGSEVSRRFRRNILLENVLVRLRSNHLFLNDFFNVY